MTLRKLKNLLDKFDGTDLDRQVNVVRLSDPYDAQPIYGVHIGINDDGELDDFISIEIE